jgi:hypothetical protein
VRWIAVLPAAAAIFTALVTPGTGAGVVCPNPMIERPPRLGDIPPVAAFNVAPLTIAAGQLATFDASASYDADGTITDYCWQFGNRALGSGPIVKYQYPSCGSFTAVVLVMDNGAATGTASRRLTVGAGPPPAGRITVTLDIGNARPRPGEAVSFSGVVSPRYDCALVAIQRRDGKHRFHTVKTVEVSRGQGNRSSFREAIRVWTAGTYRARLLLAGRNVASGAVQLLRRS